MKRITEAQKPTIESRRVGAHSLDKLIPQRDDQWPEDAFFNSKKAFDRAAAGMASKNLDLETGRNLLTGIVPKGQWTVVTDPLAD